MMRMESSAALEGKFSLLQLHTTRDVSSDCSKVTPSIQILPSLVGAHNNSPPPVLPSQPASSFFFVYSAVWSGDCCILICSTHISRFDIAKQPPLPPRPPLSLPPSCSCLIFLLLWLLVQSVVCLLTLSGRVEAFCIKNLLFLPRGIAPAKWNNTRSHQQITY